MRIRTHWHQGEQIDRKERDWQREADEADDAAQGLPTDEERMIERAEYLADMRRDREAE